MSNFIQAPTRLYELRIHNFQSLKDVQLELAPFTVIVGPSSSGKSALTRAIRTLTSNRRGTEWITHGERVAAITAVTDAGTVTLTRSRTTASADNAYVLTPADAALPPVTYSKLGGETPQDVSRFLGIPSGSSSSPPINFAGQFDKPFLLDDSASEVARVLGALTNVDVIFSGARESNRQRLNASATLKLRTGDLAEIRAEIPTFKALKAQDEALQAAESAIQRAHVLRREITALDDAITIIEVTVPLIERLTPQANIVVPQEHTFLEARDSLGRFKDTLARVPTHTRLVQAAQASYDEIEKRESELLERYQELAGGITRDLRGYMHGAIEPEYQIIHDGREYAEMDRSVEVFLQYLETRATQ